MGAVFSGSVGSEGGGMGPGLGDLPEGCIAEVLRRLDPPDICRLVRVNKTFLNAGSSNFIWEEKLPKNYGCLMKKSSEAEGKVEDSDTNKEKLGAFLRKEVYALLCRRNSFDGGNKVSLCGFVVFFPCLRITYMLSHGKSTGS
jgi:F-box domain